MKEEEIDQFFKNKLGPYAPAPSADAWARLQSKMEPPQQKRPIMWVYYAAAAVTLVLVSGVLMFWLRSNEIKQDGNLARQTPVIKNLPLRTTEPIIADLGTGIEKPGPKNDIDPELTNQNAKTQTNTATSGKPVKKNKKIRPGILIAAAAPKKTDAVTKTRPVNKAVNQTETLPATVPAVALASAALPTQDKVVEVLIKKDTDENILLAQTTEKEFETPSEAIRDNLTRKGKLVKSIFKQARNLKNGDKVEMSELGLSANYRIDVESKILKHKYSKVINL